MSEQWRGIEGYGGLYLISNCGNVWSVRADREMKKTLQCRGYYTVNLCIHGKPTVYFIHRLVALHFLGPCPEGMQVNHRDAVKTNNCASNLEYVTGSYNIRHALNLGLRNTAVGERNGRSRMTREKVLDLRRSWDEGVSVRELMQRFGIVESTVRQIISFQTWKHLSNA